MSWLEFFHYYYSASLMSPPASTCSQRGTNCHRLLKAEQLMRVVAAVVAAAGE